MQRAIDAKKLDTSKPIDGPALVAAGVIRRVRDGVRLLGKGELTAKVDFKVDGASSGAIAAVEKAGGSVTLPEVAEKPEGKRAARKKAAAEKRAERNGAAQG